MKRSITIIIAVCIYSFSFAQEKALSFHHLSKADGLSNDINSYVYKDTRGYVWISSIDGLNRFDGQAVTVYRPDINTRNSIDGNIVSSNFYEDQDANIWFTTYGSINCYVRAFDHFISFNLKNIEGFELTEDYRAFYLDEDNGLWVRTGLGAGGLLHRFDIQSRSDDIIGPIDGKRNFYLDDNTNSSHILSTIFEENSGLEIRQIEGNQVVNIHHYFRQDSQLPKLNLYNIHATSLDNIFLGSADGLITFSAVTGKYHIHRTYNGRELGRVWSIQQLNTNLLLVSSEFLGLLVFNSTSSGFVSNYEANADEPYSLYTNNIHDVYIDRSNCIWVSSWGNGIDYACIDKNRFDLIDIRKNNSRAVDISSMSLGPNGNVWVADRIEGISIFDNNKTLLRHINPLKELRYGPQNTLEHIYFDREDRLWAVVKDNSARSSQLIYKEQQGGNWMKSAQTPRLVTSMFQLPNGRMLVASRAGLLELKGDNTLQLCPEFIEYSELPFYEMFQDDLNQFYLSANFDRIFICKINEDDQLELVESINETGNVKALYHSSTDSIVWLVGSSGLTEINKYTFAHRLLTEKRDEIPSESMFSIAASRDGNLWIKNESKLLEYNIGSRTIKKFDAIDGVQSVEDNAVEQVQEESGYIWLSGPKGLTYFHPDSIQNYPIQAQPQLTKILVNSEAIALDTFVGEAQRIDLAHDDNTISLDFVPNAYSDPSESQFRYRLLDYDPVWVTGETQGVARFVNIPWGNYKFELQASNSDGIWSPTKSIEICIAPPWWATWWAYLLYLLGAYLLLQLYTKYRSRVLIHQNVKLEETVSTRTAELAKSLSDLKKTQAQLIHSEKMASLGQVTAGIAHEIQNPLNFVNNFSDVSSDLIAEMVEEMDKGDLDEARSLAADVQENMNRIAHHGRRADNIVSSMLEHSRASTGEVVPSDINSLVKENLRRTYNLINNKEQYFDTIIETNFEQTLSRINVVPQDIGRVIYNILTNALYASYEKKKTAGTEYIPTVQVSTEKSGQWISILIKDNGIGIAKDNISNVFLPFFTTKPTGEGTGLGLSLSYDIIRAHGGELKVESVESEGSTFIIQLPVKQ